MPQLLSETKVFIALLFHSLHSSTNQQLFSLIKAANMKNTISLLEQRKPSRATTKLPLFTISKDKWNTKEGTGESLKNALNVVTLV